MICLFSVMSSLHNVSFPVQRLERGESNSFLGKAYDLVRLARVPTLNFRLVRSLSDDFWLRVTFGRGPSLGTNSKAPGAESSGSSGTTLVSGSVFCGRHLTKSSKSVLCKAAGSTNWLPGWC